MILVFLHILLEVFSALAGTWLEGVCEQMGAYNTQCPALYFLTLTSLFELIPSLFLNNILILCVCLIFHYVEQVSANYSPCVKSGPMPFYMYPMS